MLADRLDPQRTRRIVVVQVRRDSNSDDDSNEAPGEGKF